VVQRPIYTARLQHQEMLSERAQCKHLRFAVEELPRFDFTAGQFVSLLAPKEGKTITRAYSIASAPNGGNRFDLCLNRVENGFFSNHLCDMKEGETVQFHGPHGHFVLREPLRDSLLIATGTGVAPMRGFVEWLFDAQHPRHEGREIHLIYGTRTESELYYAALFTEVAAKHANFHYVPTLSRPQEGWRGHKGYVQDRVQEILQARAGHGKDEMNAYICGLNLMVSANRKLLGETMGWDKKQIVFERYD
jgi:ferredoxin-NADP reductase